MKKFILMLLLIQNFLSSSSQQIRRDRIDSVLKLIQEAKKEDTTLARRYISLSSAYATLKPDSTIYYADKALILSEKLNYTWGKAWAYRNFSGGFKMLSDFPNAHEYLQKAKDIYIKANEKGRLRELEAAEANLNFTEGEYREAIDIHLHLMSTSKSRNNLNISSGYSFIAASYAGLHKPDSALYYARLAYSLKNEYTAKSWLSTIFGDAFFQLNQLDSAMVYYSSALQISQSKDPNTDMIMSMLGIANVFKRSGNADSCIYYAKLALEGARAGSFRNYIINASVILAEAYEKIDPAESIRYYKLSAAISDSVYGQQKVKQVEHLKFANELRKREAAEKDKEAKAKLRFNYLILGFFALVLIILLLVRNNRHKQKAKQKIEKAFIELKATQALLIQSEKMASLGELTAGIAHEIQNPLNFVNNFSEVNKELLVEMKDEIKKGNIDEVNALADDVIANEEKINHHGKRADAIVKGMLQHSLSSNGAKQSTDINALADEYLRLAYHGLRAKDKSFNATMKTDFDETIGKINIIPQDIGRVILNLINNAFYAAAQNPPLGGRGADPTIWVSSKKVGEKFLISVKDNGPGIPQKILDKIFQPFFTTKPTGQGTGLGLSLSYDIVKAHGGEIKVETKEGEGTEFIIQLPIN